MRIPSVCNHNPETTVFAHLGGGGMGTKHSSIHGAYACSDCHDAVDGRSHAAMKEPYYFTTQDLRNMHLEGTFRTQKLMIKDEVLKL